MGVKEKARESVSLRTSASVDAVREACRRSAAASKVLGTSTISEKADESGRVVFEVRPGKKWGAQQMLFAVNVRPSDDGHTDLSTEVLSYLTSRPAIYGFIPVGPRSVLGLKAYRRFMETLRTEVAALA